jgi:CheY-like chemotaxis protein
MARFGAEGRRRNGRIYQMSVLILDDDEKWLALHERRLRQAGVKCRTTQLAKEAIEIAKTDPTIKFALLDEILFVPPIPREGKDGELQRWQGAGVVREISHQRSDIQMIMVTSAPQLRSNGDLRLFSQETNKLSRQRGVIDLVHKQDIEADPDGEYNWLIKLFKHSQAPSSTAEVIQPKILIGLGVREEVINGAKYKPLRQCLKETGVSEYELDATVGRFLAKLQPLEKAMFIEMPGSKKLEHCAEIKTNSQSFKILEFLAQRAEQNQEVKICEEDYQYTARKSHNEIDNSQDLDPRAVADFAFGYNSEGKKGWQQGVQIEKRGQGASRLKVAISRLSEQLINLNVGGKGHVFSALGGCYRPLFEVSIILYAIPQPGRAGKRQKKA